MKTLRYKGGSGPGMGCLLAIVAVMGALACSGCAAWDAEDTIFVWFWGLFLLALGVVATLGKMWQ